MTDSEALEEVYTAFSAAPRPDYFTNYTHCEECAEHDELLRSRDLTALSIEDVGSVGWDPICFISEEGFAYYLPALCRLALDSPVERYGWYGTQLAWHLIVDGPMNRRFMFCSPEQRRAVANFVAHLILTKSDLAEDHCSSEDLIKAHDVWSESAN